MIRTGSVWTPGMAGTTHGPPAGARVPEADVVHLTLNHDGVWHVPTATASETSYGGASHRRATAPPRLAPTVKHIYAATGRLHASPMPPGLMLDLYV